MDFALSEDQGILQNSLSRMLADRYGFEQRNAYLREPAGWSRAMWAAYAELGLLGLGISGDHGGFGGGGVDIMIVMREFGLALVAEPYLASIVLGAGTIGIAGSAAQQAALLPRLYAGELICAFAHAERNSRYDLAYVETSARPDGDGWVIDGEKVFVRHGDAADQLIVSARIGGPAGAAEGLALFLVDPASAGVQRKNLRLQDKTHAAHVTFENLRVGAEMALGPPGDAFAIIRQIADRAIAAICAETVGCLEKIFDLTLEYLKTRKQFGVLIGSFQALQHRAADMFVMLELARSMMFHSAFMSDDLDAAARYRAVAAAKIQIGKAARLIGQQSIQLHGGIGLTEEYAVGHYVRRLIALETEFGDSDYHLARLAEAPRSFHV